MRRLNGLFVLLFALVLVTACETKQVPSPNIYPSLKITTNQEQVTPKSTCGDSVCDSNESYSSCPQDCSKLEEVKRIVEEYHKTNRYTKEDFYVCTDMAMAVWNEIKTQGIDAKICAGNIDEDISKSENPFINITHAWVVAEIEPFTYIAVETTGGYLVWGENATTDEVKNQLYYSGYCFDSPKQFKSFITLRDEVFNVCNEAISMENYWNENYVGTQATQQAYEYKGRMNQKEEDCASVVNEMKGLLS